MLVIRADGGLETNHVELETLALYYPLNQFTETGLGSTGQQDAESILLLCAQLDELDNLLVPPSLPCARLLFRDAFARRGENPGIVPPSTVYKRIGVRECAYRWVVPDLGIG